MTSRQSSSMEDYLEAISRLSEEEEDVRVTLLSKTLGVKKPSVTEALQRLSEEGLVKYRKYGTVELTPEGQRVAEDVVRRHDVLFRFLFEILGVDREVSQEDACKLEHSLSPPSQKKLTAFLEFLSANAEKQRQLLREFGHFVRYKKADREDTG